MSISNDHKLHLPKINFSGLIKPSATATNGWLSTRALVLAAIENYGSFEAVHDGIAPELLGEVFGRAMKELFSLPLEKKVKNMSKIPYHGYIGNNAAQYESLSVDNAIERDGVEEFVGALWGDEGNPSFCDAILDFSTRMSELEQIVRRTVLESLGMDCYFDSYIDSTTYALRLSKYGLQNTDEAPSNTPAMRSHTDVTVLSIVCQRGVEGLEVQAKDGSWLTPSPNSLTVLVGEAFGAWTNGRIKPAWHRVMMNGGDETRYSAIFSSRPKDGCLVQAPAELIDDEHPRQFMPYEYGAYVRYCFSEAGFRMKDTLKAYCGAIQEENDEENLAS